MAYSPQRYDGTNPAALAAVADGNRFAGGALCLRRVDDRPGESLIYGGEYARYGYIENALFSPRARLTIAPTDTALAGRRGRRAEAPGAEEFVAVDGRGDVAAARAHVRADGNGLRARAERHLRVTVEQDSRRRPSSACARSTSAPRISRHAVRPRQRERGRGTRSLLRRVGRRLRRARLDGQPQSGRSRATPRQSVDYRVTTAEWGPSPDGDISLRLLPGIRAGSRAGPGRDRRGRHPDAVHRDARLRALPDQQRVRRCGRGTRLGRARGHGSTCRYPVAAVHGLLQRAVGDAASASAISSANSRPTRRSTTSCSSCGRRSASSAGSQFASSTNPGIGGLR